MLKYWVLLSVLVLLRPADATDQAEPRSFSIEPTLQHTQQEDGYPNNDGIRRYECPASFFRLRRNCYYLSGGMASWRDAHFQCAARNATLAVLNRYGKDKILRKYLMGDQFRKLERWIGGMYNWRQMNWEWGVSGDKVLFQNFGNIEENNSKNFTWHCIVLDPMQQYKWNSRFCLEPKYFICEVPAGRIDRSRRRKNITDPLAPQNQRLRPINKDEYKNKVERRRKNKLKSMRKKNWHQYEDNQIWAHGIKPGSRPPKGSIRYSMKRTRLNNKEKHKVSRHNRKHVTGPEPRISHVTPRTGEFGAFAADGRVKPDERLQSLSEDEVIFPRYFGNDFTREEVLLKL